MPVAFQGVVIGAPEGVGVSFEGDSLRLSFEGFTGSVCIAPQHGSHGAPDGVAAALPVDKTPHDRPLPSSVTLFKRSRVSSPAAVTSSCSAGESLFDGAPTKASGVVAESGLLVPPDVFPNGGLSQDWYPGADEAMRLCDSEDDAVRTSDSEECFPSQRPVALQWDDAVSHSTSPLCSERLSGVEIEAHSSLAPLEQSAAGMDETVPHVPCGHVSASAGQASQNLELAEAIHAPARPDATLASLHTTGVLDAAAAGEVFPFSRDTPLFRWEWHRVAATGPPPPPRWAHCAAELNGEMLVFGGDTLADPDDGTSDRLADLYAFDAAGLRWRRCQDAPQGRAWHSGTSVRGSLDGASDIFLVFGGEAVKPPAKMIAAAVPKEPADAAAGSTAVPSTDRPKRTGRLQSLSSMLSFDPEFGVWYEAVDRGHRPSGRLGHSAVTHDFNGGGAKLLVFGGFSHGARRFVEPELHELLPSADWAWRRPISSGRPPPGCAYHTATRLSRGRVLVFGGNDAERSFAQPHVLELSSMQWSHPSTTGEAPAPRTGHAAVGLDGTRVLVYGGWDYTAHGDGFDFRDDVAILDTDAWAWTRPDVNGAPPAARVGHTMVALETGVEHRALFLFGGRSQDDIVLGDLYMLRPVT